MRDTIFSPSFGNRPAYLVGREQILQGFLNGLLSMPGSKDRAVVMLGQRGSGKTVLLWELADRAAERGYVVATPTIVSEGMLERIVEKIQEHGSRYVGTPTQAHISGATVGAFGFSAGLEFTHEVQETKTPEFKLTMLARRLSRQGHGILILIDELQANSQEVRKLVSVYQEMVGERLDVAIVLAGLPGAVSATLNDRVLTFLNRARKVSLPPLALNDVDAFYQRAFRELGVKLSGELREQAVEATQGSPYMLQLVGHGIVTRASSDGSISDDGLRAALEFARRDFENDVCETTLATLSEQDIAFIHAMSLDKGPSAMKDVAERMSVTSDYAQKYRRRLIDAGVIESAGRGRVVFAVPYLDDYLKRPE
ncbi:ATP-binding protein [Collinsella sp. An2]|nr:ATP-binding protein [Collinsella sp. An2]